MNSLLIAALLAMAAPGGGEPKATTLEGRAIVGKIVAWDENEVALETSDGRVFLPVAELLDIRWDGEIAQASAGMFVELVDNTRIVYSQISIANRRATIAGNHFKRPIQVSRDLIRLVELRPSTPQIESVLNQIAQKELPGDSLVVAQRDSESMDYLTGVIGDVTEEQASFDWDGEHLPVKRTKIAAMTFYQAREQTLPDAVCELLLIDGSRISARRVLIRNELINVTTPGGVRLEVPFDQVTRADFSSGKLAYLSELTATAVRWTPGLGVPDVDAISDRNLPHNNASFTGKPLSLLWKDDPASSRREVRTYAKGLAVRSRTESTYRIPEGMSRFTATAGIDPENVGQGNVLLVIRGDDEVLWEGVVDRRQPPVEIDVELGMARRLHLNVDFGDHLDFGDRLHLVEARFTR